MSALEPSIPLNSILLNTARSRLCFCYHRAVFETVVQIPLDDIKVFATGMLMRRLHCAGLHVKNINPLTKRLLIVELHHALPRNGLSIQIVNGIAISINYQKQTNHPSSRSCSSLIIAR